MSVNLGLWILLGVVVAFAFGPPVVRDLRWRLARRRRPNGDLIELPLGKRRLP